MDPSMNDLYVNLMFRNGVSDLMALSSRFRNSSRATLVRDKWDQCQYDSEQQLTDNLLMGLFGRHYSTNVPYLVAVVCFGFVTNLLNLVILTRLHMRNSINVLLAALAISDLLVLSVEIPGILQYYYFHQLTSKAWVVAFAYIQAFRFMSRVLSNGLTVTVGSWRCVAVTWPLYAKEWCSNRRAWVAIACVALCALTLSVPVYFSIVHISCSLNTVESSKKKEQNILYVNVFNEHLGLNSRVLGAFVISITYVPCLGLSVVTLCLIHSLCQANNKRKLLRVQTSRKNLRFSTIGVLPSNQKFRGGKALGGKNTSSEDTAMGGKKLTLMLLVVLLLFVFNNLPSAIAVTASLISRDAVYASQDFTFILDMFTVLDNSLSFLAYVIMSRKFRHTFLKLFGLDCVSVPCRSATPPVCTSYALAVIS